MTPPDTSTSLSQDSTASARLQGIQAGAGRAGCVRRGLQGPDQPLEARIGARGCPRHGHPEPWGSAGQGQRGSRPPLGMVGRTDVVQDQLSRLGAVLHQRHEVQLGEREGRGARGADQCGTGKASPSCSCSRLVDQGKVPRPGRGKAVKERERPRAPGWRGTPRGQARSAGPRAPSRAGWRSCCKACRGACQRACRLQPLHIAPRTQRRRPPAGQCCPAAVARPAGPRTGRAAVARP